MSLGKSIQIPVLKPMAERQRTGARTRPVVASDEIKQPILKTEFAN